MSDKTIEIEVDGRHNESLVFAPLQRRVRGRFDWSRVGEPQARVRATEEPGPIPGQRIAWDPEAGKLAVIEPLHEAEFAALRERIERKGLGLPPAREEQAADESTALYWMQRAVKSGVAKLVRGAFPKQLKGEPQKEFIIRREPSQGDKLTAAIERQNELFEKLLDRLAK